MILSNLGGVCNVLQLDKILKKLKKADLDIFLVGPDLPEEDDTDSDHTEDVGADTRPKGRNRGDGGSAQIDLPGNKYKSAIQLVNENTFVRILRHVGGVSYSFQEATQAVNQFQLRATAQRPWTVNLTIGREISLPVQGFTSVSEARPVSFKDVYARDPDAQIELERTYHRNDEAETEVDLDDTVKGFRYGRTLVPFNENDLANMKYSTPKSMVVLGFTAQDHVPLHMRTGNLFLSLSPLSHLERIGIASR